jgi:hypothetical protein
MVATVLLAGVASAADAILVGKVKNIRSARKEIVVTDTGAKDRTIKLGENVIINHGGKESSSDLNVGDTVNVCYDKGTFTWTAHYILVNKGESKNWKLVLGTFKGYNTDKQQMTFHETGGKDMTLAWGDGKVRVNRKLTAVKDIKIGDKGIFVLDEGGAKTFLKAVLLNRK